MSTVPRFRHARPVDGFDDHGRPIVNRPPATRDIFAPLLSYLEAAPVVLAARSCTADIFIPSDIDVPLNFRTDGVWIWPGSVPHYLRKHGTLPEPDLVTHAISRRFSIPELNLETLRLAAREAAPANS